MRLYVEHPERVRAALARQSRERLNSAALKRDECVEPFSFRDMPGQKPLKLGEYITVPVGVELAMMGLGDSRGLEGKKVLYIGLGRSDVPKKLQAAGADVFGLDIEKDIAKYSHASGISTMFADAARNPYFDDVFDRVLLRYVVAPSEEPEKIVRESLRVCREGGKVTIYPVMSFVNVDEPGFIPGLAFTRWGLDYFTVEITKDAATNEQALEKLFDPELFALKPVPEETTRRRLKGYYYAHTEDGK